jgi:hypothetical protein
MTGRLSATAKPPSTMTAFSSLAGNEIFGTGERKKKKKGRDH